MNISFAGWNPNYVEAPFEVNVLFAVPQFNHIHPRKRRLKFKRRYVKKKLKEYLTPPPSKPYCSQDYAP